MNDSDSLFNKDFFYDLGVGLGILIFGMLAIAGLVVLFTVI